MSEKLDLIKSKAQEALKIGRTIGDKVLDKQPVGWMPPKQQMAIAKLLEEIIKISTL